MAAHGLSDNEVAEIRKAFSMCDTDGSGSIDAAELRNLMRAVTNSEVTDAELGKVMNLVDVDRSGSIELEEFVSVISAWLGGRDAATSPQLGKRRKRKVQSGQEEREEVHKKIKAFFQQEKRQQSLDEVARDLQKEAVQQRRREGNVLLADSDVLDSHQKLEVLAHCKRVLTNVQPLVADLGSQSITQQVEGAKSLASLLHIVEVGGRLLHYVFGFGFVFLLARCVILGVGLRSSLLYTVCCLLCDVCSSMCVCACV
jgi:EF-hand domain pair